MQREYKNTFSGFASLISNLLRLLFDKSGEMLSLFPYRKQDSILTPAEQRFYQVLLKAVEDKATITPKVNLQDVFSVVDWEHNKGARNRISQRHVDFLVCEPKTLRPMFGIELDDSSHEEVEHKKRDEFKDSLFEATRLPLVRIPVKFEFDVDEVRKIIQTHLEEKEKSPPLCPHCGVLMVVKTARRGIFNGKSFYSCPNFPRCTAKQDI